MTHLMQLLLSRKKQLESIIKATEKSLTPPISGRIEARWSLHNPQFYHVTQNKGQILRKYLHRSEDALVRRYFQYCYAKEVYKLASQELKALQNYLIHNNDDKIMKQYQSLHPKKKTYVTPVILPQENAIVQWKNQKSAYQNSYPITSDFFTINGEHVRSKSELMIADKLFYAGIPYKYENGILLKGKLVFPDFTIWNSRNNTELIWEHLGQMDSPQYLQTNSEKLMLYFLAGFIPGINLLLTFETAANPLSSRTVDQIITYLSTLKN